jgi:transcriptional regulator with XRE-family HTH domain
MANQLKMAVVNAIRTLTQVGWSQRRIAGVLGIDRETVARYVHAPPAEAKPATNPIPGPEPL